MPLFLNGLRCDSSTKIMMMMIAGAVEASWRECYEIFFTSRHDDVYSDLYHDDDN